MTMEEDWVWMPHKTAVPAVHMAVSVHPPPSRLPPRAATAAHVTARMECCAVWRVCGIVDRLGYDAGRCTPLEDQGAVSGLRAMAV